MLAAALLLTAAACGNDDADLPEQVPELPAVEEPAATVELSAEEQEAVDGAREAFDAFLTAYNEILTAGEPATDSVLARILPYAGGQVSQAANGEIFDNYQANKRLDGQVEWTFAEVVDVDLDYIHTIGDGEINVPLAWLSYCVDATNWATVDKDSGEPAPQGENHLIEQPGGRHLVTVAAEYFDPVPGRPENERQPTWRVSGWEDERDDPC